MLPYIFPLLLTFIASASGWTYLFLKVPPQTPFVIALFLVLAFIGLISLLTIIIFAVSCKIYDRFTPAKSIFGESLRRAVLVSLIVVGVGTLRLLKATSPMNIGLLIAALSAAEIYFSTR